MGMTPSAEISVAIATKDRPEELARCLESVLSGSTVPAEVIVVDQSQQSRTRALKTEHPNTRIRIVHVYQAGSGLPASRNAAIHHCTQPYIAFTDDDCVADQQWLAAIARHCQAAKAADIISGRVLPLGPETHGLYAVSSRTDENRAVFQKRTWPWRVGTGANMTVSMAWLARAGGFDMRLGAGTPGRAAEDLEFLDRSLSLGCTVAYEPDAVIYHERQCLERRLSSRLGYGHGIGALAALGLMAADPFRAAILVRWAALRCRLLARGCARRDRRAIREELLVLRGTCAGVLYGIRASLRTEQSQPDVTQAASGGRE